MVEHRTPNPGVGGSNPSWPANDLSFSGARGVHVRQVMSTKKQLRTNKSGVDSKKDTLSSDRKSSFSPAAIRTFLQEVLAEFRKIVWPEKKVTMGLTGFVIVLVVIISLYLGSVDLLLGKLVSTVLK